MAVRVLCLHGYAGNAARLRTQLVPLLPAFGDAELVYLDAPSLAAGDYGWWHSPATGWERSRAAVLEVFATQPRFDGVLGMSQGAALTGLLAGMRENGEPGVEFDFAVMVGGFINDAEIHEQYYRQRFTVSSLHILGEMDGVIAPVMSRALAKRFDDPVVLTHPGGHIVPADANVRDGLTQFLSRGSRRGRCG